MLLDRLGQSNKIREESYIFWGNIQVWVPWRSFSLWSFSFLYSFFDLLNTILYTLEMFHWLVWFFIYHPSFQRLPDNVFFRFRGNNNKNTVIYNHSQNIWDKIETVHFRKVQFLFFKRFLLVLINFHFVRRTQH